MTVKNVHATLEFFVFMFTERKTEQKNSGGKMPPLVGKHIATCIEIFGTIMALMRKF